MRARTFLLLGAVILAAASLGSATANAGDRGNPNGWGLYSPDRGAYRYDPRSWYYRRPGYYPYNASNYWVPRAEMRHRYRYLYYGDLAI